MEATLAKPRTKWTWRKISRFLWRIRLGVLGGVIVFVLVITALFAPYIAPHDPYEQSLTARLKPPVWQPKGSWEHILGTDHVGRDMLSRIIYGARVSLSIGALAVGFSLLIGVTLGILSGYYGGIIDSVINFAVNVTMGFPSVLLAMALIATVGASFEGMIFVLGITSWFNYTRVVRSEVLVLREQEFSVAAKALGASELRTILRHILPNLVNSILVLATIQCAQMIIAESILSFLGLGIKPPTPAWGSMLGEGRNLLLVKPWLATFPGMAIFLAALSINMLGEGLRDILDPHQH